MGITQEEGVVEGKTLAIIVASTRIDLIATATNDPESSEAGFPTMGSLTQNLEWFISLARRWLALTTRPPLQRLAFGAVLEHPVGNRPEGYRYLSRVLPAVTLDPDGSSDFLYQINRPRNVTVPGLEIGVNRLSKWLVAVLRIAIISPRLERLGPEFFAARLELDVNTEQDFAGEFSETQVVAVFDELIRLGVEISNHGDIP